MRGLGALLFGMHVAAYFWHGRGWRTEDVGRKVVDEQTEKDCGSRGGGAERVVVGGGVVKR